MHKDACSDGNPRSIYYPNKGKPILAMGSRRSDVAGTFHAGNVRMQDINGQAVRIREAVSVSDIADMRRLFIEYQRWLGQDLTFQSFSAELATLPGDYAPPLGRMLLARHVDGTAVAGVAMKPLSAGICEMKRLFVRRFWRGTGLGRTLAEAIVDAGRTVGYGLMRLDTFSRLSAATELYRSLGFREIAPYYENPLDGVIYMEKVLDPCGGC